MATKRNTRNKEQKKTVPWGPMFISFAVGLFAMFLIHLNDNVEPQLQEKNKKPIKIEKKSKAVEPTFEFYSLLPEMEVVVNDRPKKTSSKPVKNVKAEAVVKIDDNARYLLQVGSFRKLADADGFKARLAFLGIESKVQTVTIDNKDTWHRVQVGPIVGREKADSVKLQLKQNKIDSLLVRIKHG